MFYENKECPYHSHSNLELLWRRGAGELIQLKSGFFLILKSSNTSHFSNWAIKPISNKVANSTMLQHYNVTPEVKYIVCIADTNHKFIFCYLSTHLCSSNGLCHCNNDATKSCSFSMHGVDFSPSKEDIPCQSSVTKINCKISLQNKNYRFLLMLLTGEYKCKGIWYPALCICCQLHGENQAKVECQHANLW